MAGERVLFVVWCDTKTESDGLLFDANPSIWTSKKTLPKSAVKRGWRVSPIVVEDEGNE